MNSVFISIFIIILTPFLLRGIFITMTPSEKLSFNDRRQKLKMFKYLKLR
jgi:hypothetical protein